MQELGTVLWSLGPNPTKAELQKVVGELVCDGRGPVGFPKLLGLMAWKQISVSTAKWWHAVTWLGKELNNQEVEEMIRAAHMDADGQVDCEEFMHLLVSTSVSRHLRSKSSENGNNNMH
ncbi:PREDICTED: calmodulin-like protein 3 [Capra hircus]|uniref:calmodulin-like protein 3 n=1 Tax=Capra hircus TaxID=9925 RepID=UPI0006B11E7C|nr:PREDICTED: calmodulin-like protein 3 [Capra hircus]